MNLPEFGTHLGGDYWSGGGCTDFGQTVYAVADGEVVEIVDALGSYLDVVVIRHDDPQVGPVYSMYGHISRDAGLAIGQSIDYRDPIGFIDDVLAYFSPCHLHFELLSEEAYSQGPFCSGCAGAGYNVSPGYDQGAGVMAGAEPSGDTWLEVADGIAGNRWFHTDAFIDARLDATCGACGDGICDASENYDACPADCPPCQLIEPPGGTLDETGPCFFAGGSAKYWVLEDVGYDRSLRWTHTTDSEIIDNYGIWNFAFAEAGQYRLEVHIEPGHADSQLAAYDVVHGRGVQTVVIDQSGAAGWTSLGEFSFAAGGMQSLRLDDNTGEPFSGMTRLVFDAVRLTRLDLPPGGTDGGDTTGDDSATGAPADDTMGGGGSAATAPGDSGDGGQGTAGDDDGPALPGGGQDGGGDGCACRSAAPRGMPSAWLWLWLVALAVVRRRRIGATAR